jgi:hypothetical protein
VPIKFFRPFEHGVVTRVFHDDGVEVRLDFPDRLNIGGKKITVNGS